MPNLAATNNADSEYREVPARTSPIPAARGLRDWENGFGSAELCTCQTVWLIRNTQL